jgi:hypothetical protein
MAPMWKLIGIAIGLVVVAVVAGLGILSAGVSAGLNSAVVEISAFLVLIGLGIAIGLLTGSFPSGSGKK